MTTLEFISGMKKLGSFYFKELTSEQISLWYEMFQDVSVDVFNQAIKEISRENKFMPNANELFNKCSQSNKNNLLDLINFMYDDGYFHRGVERLSDEQARRNLDKTMMWLEKGIIPSFLKEDMQEYMKKYKQSQIQNQERLKIEC
jgi:hypothetical protein